MYSFYGGPKGKDFEIKRIFNNVKSNSSGTSLEEDLTAGLSSMVGVGELAFVSYGSFSEDKGMSEDYQIRKNLDLEAYGRTFNGTLWKKEYLSTYLNPAFASQELAKNVAILRKEANNEGFSLQELTGTESDISTEGFCYVFVSSFSGEVPQFSFVNEDDKIQDEKYEDDDGNEITSEGYDILNANEEPYVRVDYTDVFNPRVNVGLPQAQVLNNTVLTTTLNPTDPPRVSLDDTTDINSPQLTFELPRAMNYVTGGKVEVREGQKWQDGSYVTGDFEFWGSNSDKVRVGDYYIEEKNGFIYKITNVVEVNEIPQTLELDYLGCLAGVEEFRNETWGDANTAVYGPYSNNGDGSFSPRPVIKVGAAELREDEKKIVVPYTVAQTPMFAAEAEAVAPLEEASAFAAPTSSSTVTTSFKIPRGARWFSGDLAPGEDGFDDPADIGAGDYYIVNKSDSNTGPYHGNYYQYIGDNKYIEKGNLRGNGVTILPAVTLETVISGVAMTDEGIQGAILEILKDEATSPIDKYALSPNEIVPLTAKVQDGEQIVLMSYWVSYVEDNWILSQLTGTTSLLVSSETIEDDDARIETSTYSASYLNENLPGDWQENNVDSPKYINNRTHYIYKGYVSPFPQPQGSWGTLGEVTVVEDSSTVYYGTSVVSAPPETYITDANQIIESDFYKITFEETEYVDVPKYTIEGTNGFFIGAAITNGWHDIFSVDKTIDFSKYPFCFWITWRDFGDGIRQITLDYITPLSSVSNVEIIPREIAYQKLDVNYLPDNLNYLSNEAVAGKVAASKPEVIQHFEADWFDTTIYSQNWVKRILVSETGSEENSWSSYKQIKNGSIFSCCFVGNKNGEKMPAWLELNWGNMNDSDIIAQPLSGNLVTSNGEPYSIVSSGQTLLLKYDGNNFVVLGGDINSLSPIFTIFSSVELNSGQLQFKQSNGAKEIWTAGQRPFLFVPSDIPSGNYTSAGIYLYSVGEVTEEFIYIKRYSEGNLVDVTNLVENQPIWLRYDGTQFIIVESNIVSIVERELDSVKKLSVGGFNRVTSSSLGVGIGINVDAPYSLGVGLGGYTWGKEGMTVGMGVSFPQVTYGATDSEIIADWKKDLFYYFPEIIINNKTATVKKDTSGVAYLEAYDTELDRFSINHRYKITVTRNGEKILATEYAYLKGNPAEFENVTVEIFNYAMNGSTFAGLTIKSDVFETIQSDDGYVYRVILTKEKAETDAYLMNTGQASTAVGISNLAVDMASFATGAVTLANGPCSFSMGTGTESNANQLTLGHFNESIEGNCSGMMLLWKDLDTSVDFTTGTALVVGNGSMELSNEEVVTNYSNAFRVNYDGTAVLQGALSANGADYAEYFEWADGNPNGEDRCGLVVTLDGDKIKKASSGDYVLGIVSGAAVVVGDAHDDDWQGKYKKDVYGRRIKETKNGATRFAIDESYDDNQEYIPRKDRQEWDTVGLVGKLIVRDNGTCEVNGFAAPGADGVATIASSSNLRVIKRIDENHIQVVKA